MSKEKQKEKVIKLYKLFLENKEHEIKKYWRYDNPKTDLATVKEAEWGWSRTENEYRYNDYKLDENNKNYLTKLGLYNFLDEGKILVGGIKEIAISLSKQPNIILKETIKPEKSGEHNITIPHKGWRAWYKDDVKIVLNTYELKTKRTLSFGKIEFDLSKKEFDELYKFAYDLYEIRGSEIDEAKLDKRLEEYSKGE